MIKFKKSVFFARICMALIVSVGLLAAIAIPTFSKDNPSHHKHCENMYPDLEELQALDDTNFQVLYPYKFTDYEKAGVKKYFADNAALKTRGPIDIHKLVNDADYRANTPGVGPLVPVTREMVLYFNNRIDPENPIRHDTAYAKSAGYKDILAFMSYGANDDTYMVPWPREIRDKMLVSDLNHSITTYVPIYPGDTLFMVANERKIFDITPKQGSTYRSVVIQSKGSIYNQRYEKVSDVVFRVTEGERIFTDDYAAIHGHSDPGDFWAWWQAPDWLTRQEHYYTDKDWEFIKSVWKNEKVRGSDPLYWEDVKIGDKPAWTLDGPIYEGLRPTIPWGMGLYGSRTIKKEILDPDIFPTLYRSPLDGIYYLSPDPNAQNVPVPGDPSYPDVWSGGDPATRMRVPPLTNYTTRDFAIRHITNWMGDQGWLLTIGWSIMDPRCHAEFGSYAPTSPVSVRYLHRVPGMECRYVNVHGLQKDIALVKSYVINKWVRDGKHFVELIFWVETIEGDIWTEGGAIVQLPSKHGHRHGHER